MEYLWLFVLYAFAGWIVESFYAALKKKQFVNSGVLGGPFCCIYGFVAVLSRLLMPELADKPIFLFIGGGILFAFCEWVGGKLLEWIYGHRWWDYSGRKHHLDGYTSPSSFVRGGVIGVVSIKYLNALIFTLMRILPDWVTDIALWVVLGVIVLDVLWTYSYILGLPQRLPGTDRAHSHAMQITLRLNEWITTHTQVRIEKTYPASSEAKLSREKQGFAQGCGFYKLFLLFVIASFLGDIVETLFCRVTGGEWMSRSSLVWGPFSVVWGLAIALATGLLYNYRDKSDRFIFTFGAIAGGAYEYACSVFTELVFGQIFWDYSAMPFNLGGRINLLYCFFWGIAAVVWLKVGYPFLSGYIERIPRRIGTPVTWLLVAFMCVNAGVSIAALVRYDARDAGIPAPNTFYQWIDENFDDDTMARIYPNARQVL